LEAKKQAKMNGGRLAGANSKINTGYFKKSVLLFRKSTGLTPNSAIAEFYLHLQMAASCILRASKYFQCLKTLALAGG
jgi:hypothetical protein